MARRGTRGRSCMRTASVRKICAATVRPSSALGPVFCVSSAIASSVPPAPQNVEGQMRRRGRHRHVVKIIARPKSSRYAEGERKRLMRSTVEEISGRGPAAVEVHIAAPPADRHDLGTGGAFADLSELPATSRYLGALIAGAAKRGFLSDPARGMEARFTRILTAVNDALAQEA